MSNRKYGFIMQIIQNPLKKDWSTILERPTKTVDDIEAIVNTVFNDIKNNFRNTQGCNCKIIRP
mgnify:CR=1 FL=1